MPALQSGCFHTKKDRRTGTKVIIVACLRGLMAAVSAAEEW